jgi:N-acetylmuramoyl-L-alanine amidase
MQARRREDAALAPMRRHLLVAAGRLMLVIAGASLLAVVLISGRLIATGGEVPPTSVSSAAGNVTPSAYPTTISSPTPLSTHAPRVGIVAGHSGYDPGAVCPDGTTEADVNMAIAKEVVALLVRKGYQVDLLKEFDERLTGYRANALVSIHADSCDVPGASGFKVARVTDSAIPEAEDRLVACLYREYQAETGLMRHPSSITDNMTSYHAFREIDYYTPGAIIETGFLLDDYDLLVQRPKVVARGVAAGVVCFLEDSAP